MSHGAFEEIACYRNGCGQIIVAHTDVLSRWRRTGETFHCPGGHAQCFNGGKTADQKRIVALEAEVERLRGRMEWWREREEETRRELHRCRWTGCTYQADTADRYDFRALWSHMRAAHGMPSLAALQAQSDDESRSA